ADEVRALEDDERQRIADLERVREIEGAFEGDRSGFSHGRRRRRGEDERRRGGRRASLAGEAPCRQAGCQPERDGAPHGACPATRGAPPHVARDPHGAHRLTLALAGGVGPVKGFHTIFLTYPSITE